MAETRHGHVTVIGAGIVGVCSALALRQAGFGVTIYDPLTPGHSTSYGNAGIIADGAVVPYSTPGLWRQLPWMVLNSMSPLKLRSPYLLQAAPWVSRFLAQGTLARTRANAADLASLCIGTHDAHKRLMKHHKIDVNLLLPCGALDVYRTREVMHKQAFARSLYAEHGVRTQELTPDEVRQMEPALKAPIEGGLFFPDKGFVPQPIKLTEAYLQAFLRLGGEIRQEKVVRFEFGQDGPDKLITDLSMAKVDRLLLCAGAWSKPLARQLGAAVPLDTERGYHLNLLSDPDVQINRPVLVADDYFVFAPMHDGLRITSGSELGGLKLGPDFRRIHRISRLAQRMVPELKLRVTREWMGYRPSMPDSKPVIGRSSRFARVFFAFGHGHLGLTQSARTAELITELASGKPPSIDLTGFSPDRFR